jgi:hypothetical protein
MESDTDVGSEISFGSSHSSCEESSPTSLSAPVPFFIDPSNVQEFHNYLRTKQQSVRLFMLTFHLSSYQNGCRDRLELV